MVQPQHPGGPQNVAELPFDALPVKVVVPVGIEETFRGGQDGAPAVALNAPPLEDKLRVPAVFGIFRKGLLAVERGVDHIVEAGIELVAPAVEGEIVHHTAPLPEGAHRTVVPRPGVVRGNLVKPDACPFPGGKMALRGFPAAAHHQQRRRPQNLTRHHGITQLHLFEHPRPVGALMRPGQHHRLLIFPLGRKPHPAM